MRRFILARFYRNFFQQYYFITCMLEFVRVRVQCVTVVYVVCAYTIILYHIYTHTLQTSNKQHSCIKCDS
jgi:hypothetical protein